MATIENKYVLTLTEAEAVALKKLLGNMNDEQFARAGITGDSRMLMSEIWDLLPYEE